MMCVRRERQDQDEGYQNGQDLERDGIHVNWDVCSEESGSTLVAVEEGGSDSQGFHHLGGVLNAYAPFLNRDDGGETILIGVR
jgi:hypothetical protein